MPDRETLELIALIVAGLAAALLVLGSLAERGASKDPEVRRRAHAAAARKSLTLAMVCVGLLVLALLLGRILLGAMALAGMAGFGTLAVVRSRLSRERG